MQQGDVLEIIREGDRENFWRYKEGGEHFGIYGYLISPSLIDELPPVAKPAKPFAVGDRVRVIDPGCHYHMGRFLEVGDILTVDHVDSQFLGFKDESKPQNLTRMFPFRVELATSATPPTPEAPPCPIPAVAETAEPPTRPFEVGDLAQVTKIKGALYKYAKRQLREGDVVTITEVLPNAMVQYREGNGSAIHSSLLRPYVPEHFKEGDRARVLTLDWNYPFYGRMLRIGDVVEIVRGTHMFEGKERVEYRTGNSPGHASVRAALYSHKLTHSACVCDWDVLRNNRGKCTCTKDKEGFALGKLEQGEKNGRDFVA